MRTLHFCQSFSPLSQTFVYDYVTELESQGVDNHVVTLRRVNRETRPFSEVTTVNRPGRWHPRRLWNRALVALDVRRKGTSFWPQVRDRLENAVQQRQPDVIHAHFGPAAVLIAPVAERCEIPLVVSFHGYDAFELPTESFWQEKYAQLFRRSAHITAVSKVMSDHLNTVGAPAEKVSVLRVGKRLGNYPYSTPTSPVRKWISVGRLVEKKGYEDCIAAFNQHVDQFPKTSLDIIGEGERAADLKNQVRDLGLTEKVHFHGNRPHDEVKECMRGADGFILCSKKADSGDQEGVPTVLMEAQAMGLPTVSTTHSGIPEVIPQSHHDLLAPEGNVDAIADRIDDVASRSVEELVQMAERGREKVRKEFNLVSEVGSLRYIYHSL